MTIVTTPPATGLYRMVLQDGVFAYEPYAEIPDPPPPPPPPPPPAGEWPPVVGVTPYAVSTGVGMTLPSTNTPIADARWPTTMIKRISFGGDMAAPTSGPGWNNFGPVYAAQQSWNVGNTLMMIAASVHAWNGASAPTYSNTNIHLYDDEGDYVKKCQNSGGVGLPGTAKWSNSDADEILFVYGYTDVAAYNDVAGIHRWRPSTEAYSLVKSFAPTYDKISPTWSGGVNDPDITGRYFLLGLRKPGGTWYAVCWDRVADSILCEIELPEEPGTNGSIIPQIEMSRSGEFLTIMTTWTWDEGATSRPRGLNIYNRSGTWLRCHYHGPGSGTGDQSGATLINSHSGNAQDVDGEDVYLYLYGDTGNTDSRRIKSIRLDGTQTMPGRDECDNGIFMGLHYIESYSYDAPGWAVVSDGPVTTGNASASAYPMRGHIWAIKLNGSKAIRPIAQSRFSAVDFSAGDTYPLMPWATPNRDMTKILFKSTFDTDWSTGAGGIPTEIHAILASDFEV